MVLAIGLHFIFPIRQIIELPYRLLGLIFIFLGLILNIWSIKVLKEKKTPIDFDKQTIRLVTDGPFLISRNPIYLSGVLVSLGLAISLGSLVTFIFPIVLFLILDKYHIPYEEKKLEKIFGKEYIKYKIKIKRWI